MYRIQKSKKSMTELIKNMQSMPLGHTQLNLREISEKKLDEIIEFLQAVPEEIIGLDLSNFQLNNQKSDAVIAILNAIPSWVSSVNLSQNQLALFTKEELILILDALPVALTCLNLESNNLGTKSADDLSAILATLAKRPKLTTLSLGANRLYLRKNDFEKIFSASASLTRFGNIKSLNLSNNKLGSLDTDKLVDAIGQLQGVTSLNLGRNHLNQKSVDGKLIDIFQAMPMSISDLNLEANCFNTIETKNLINILKSIPEHIASLSLNIDNATNNYPENAIFDNLAVIIPAFKNKDDEEIKQILEAIPETVTSLNLSGLGLGQRGINSLIKIINAIPKGVTTLRFGDNLLGGLKRGELSSFIAAIPSHITSVDLNNNKLGKINTNELKSAFSAFPKHITTVSLDKNSFYEQNNHQLSEILGAIPLHVKNISLKKNKLFSKIKKTNDFFNIFQKNMKEPERFNWEGNQESNFSRAIAPMISLSTQSTKNTNIKPLSADSVAMILSFLAPPSITPRSIQQLIEKNSKTDMPPPVESHGPLTTISALFTRLFPTRNHTTVETPNKSITFN